MGIADILKQTGALDSISNQLGISPSVARAGADALLPAILGGFKKQGEPGLGGLFDALGGNTQDDTQSGNVVLGQIFGSKDVSRTVADQASQTSGIDPALLKKMLPILAMVVTAYLSSRGGGANAQSNDAGGGIFGQILGGLASGGLGGALGGGQAQPSGGLGSLGGLASLIDLDGDGNPLDDILGMAAKLGR